MTSRTWYDVMRVGLIMLFLTGVCSSASGTCPHGCSCTKSIIDCRHSNLTSVPTNIPLSESITDMLMSGNRIKGIGSEFKTFPNLVKIDVSSNNISSISGRAFSRLSRLQTLIMRRNFLSKLANDTFQGLVELKTLDLGYNVLKILPSDSFQDLSNLQQMDLMKNNISTINKEAFRGMGSLKVLNLTRNLLQELPAGAFSRLKSLDRLILDDNKLKTIPKFAFSNLGKLTYLSLNGNHLESIDALAFGGASPPLKELNLKGADLDEVPIEAFTRLTELEILDISKNNFSILKRGSFSELLKLKKLVITSSKHLRKIENGTFQFMFDLEKLVVRNNKALETIESAAFPATPTLQYVDLSSNSIKTFYPSICDWDNNVSVDLRNNPLFCDCKILWMVATLRNASNAKTRLFAKNLTCAAPSSFSGKAILSLPVSTFLCSVKQPSTFDPTRRVKVAAIAAVITSLILITCALFVKFRKRICMVVRRQYRYRHYKNNGVFTVNGKNGDLHEEGTPMEVISTYKDDPDFQNNDR